MSLPRNRLLTHVLVKPDVKLCVGGFDCFVDAFGKQLKLPEPESWFIVRIVWLQARTRDADHGWKELHV